VTCEQVLAQISDYFDQELDRESRTEFERHVRTCAACRAFAASLQLTIALCRQSASALKLRPLPAAVSARCKSAWQESLFRGSH